MPQVGAETRRRVRIKSALTSETICLNKATMAFQMFQGVEQANLTEKETVRSGVEGSVILK